MQTFVNFSKYEGLELRHEMKLYSEKVSRHYLAILELAEVEVLNKWELPDQYHERQYMPWLLVKTKYGLLKMGWRKRVMSIEWSDIGFKAKDLTADEVTKEDYLVHAWTVPKAIEYITELFYRIRESNRRDNAEG
jgi:hypothetical protein